MPIHIIDSSTLQQTLSLEGSPDVLLVTNAADLDRVPSAIRCAADRTSPASKITGDSFRGPQDGRETILWLDGETLLEGTPEGIRRAVRRRERTSFVTVHFPGFKYLDLLAIQPRLFGAGQSTEEAVDFTVRAGWGAASVNAAAGVLHEMHEPWAKLAYALYRDQIEPGAALGLLERLRRDEKLPPILDSLALRNLVVLRMRQASTQKALNLLQQAKRRYPDNNELEYVDALIAFDDGDFARAISLLEGIGSRPRGTYVTSGGETTYRAQWLIGTIGERVGNQAVSFGHFLGGLNARPSFEPSVVGLMKQRLPNEIVDSLQWELCHLVRREPRYLEPVFYFLLIHRAFPAARRLLNTLELDAAQRSELQQKFDLVASSYTARPASSSRPTGVSLTGPFFVHSSIARINREIASALLACGDFSAGLEPHGFALLQADSVSGGTAIRDALYSRPHHLDLTIRHHWPHDFSAPAAGKLAVIVPWEFGSIPRAWVSQIEENVDELWVPSGFVRDVFVRCGVSLDRVAVIPNGLDTQVFRPEGISWRPPEARGFTFLFVGGAIERKGVDVLVKAYQSAFTANDDVTLIIKDIGSKAFYSHMTRVPWLQKEAEKEGRPRLLILTDDFGETKLAELYRGCDASVLPYRGEGFGMPLIEAMASGKPVITTAEGPAREFCPRDCSYLISAKSVPVPDGVSGIGEFVSEPTWFEPDVEELACAMRAVFENRTEAAERGARAGKLIRREYDWRRVTAMYIDRIAAQTGHALRIAAPALQATD